MANDDDDTFICFSLAADCSDLWLDFDTPVQHVRIRRNKVKSLYALLHTQSGKVSQPTFDHATVIGWKCDMLAVNLKYLRAMHGWSQSELARRVWGSIPTKTGRLVAKNRDRISVYEKGKSQPRQRHLEAIATALGVRADDLAFGI